MSTELPQLLTIIEAAACLRVTKARAYELARRGLIPGVVRLGRQVRVSAAALARFIGASGGGELPDPRHD